MLQGVVFDSCCSTFDTYLRIIRGTEVDLSASLSSVETPCATPTSTGCQVDFCDDCGPCGLQTVLELSNTTLMPPGEYLLVVEGYASVEGDYTIEMRPLDGTSACPNGDLPHLLSLAATPPGECDRH